MAEEEKEVKTFTVDYKCPSCNDGYMRPTGTVLTSNPPQFPHRCNRESGCGFIATFNKTYPYIDYR